LFMEYGISNKVDAVLTLPFIVGNEEKNFQDMGLFVKYRPLYIPIKQKLKFGIILSTGCSFPISKYEPDVTGALGQRAIVIPIKMVSQLEFEKGGFINFTNTYNFRADKVTDATVEKIRQLNPTFQPSRPGNFITLLVKGGMALEHNYFDLYVEYQKTFGGINFEDNIVKPSQLYSVDYIKVGVGYFYAIDDHTGFSLGASYIPKGENIGNIFSFSGSFIIKIYKKKEA